MLADQSVIISGTTISLPKLGQSLSSGEFKSPDGLVKETVSHQATGKRNRRLVRIDHRKVAADPFLAGTNAEYSMSCYVVFDVPNYGYTVAEQKAVVDGFITQLNATSGALITKILGGES